MTDSNDISLADAPTITEQVRSITPAVRDTINFETDLNPPWSSKEKSRHRQAFTEYWAMGPGRNLQELIRRWIERSNNGESVPATGQKAVTRWKHDFSWDERIRNLDRKLRQEVVGAVVETNMADMTTGLATITGRVAKLKELADILWEDIVIEGNRWLEEEKTLGRAGITTVRRFNSPLIDVYRRTLDDIAKELGHRNGEDPVKALGGERIQEKPIEEVREDRWKDVAHILGEVLHIDLDVIEAEFEEPGEDEDE